MKDRQLFPLFDATYLGFNSGNFDDGAFAIRHFIRDHNMEAVVCMSFAKNMGLYGERVGCTVVVSKDERSANCVQSALEAFQRSEISNPPTYGAKIVSRILHEPRLKEQWLRDLKTMSSRIRRMRYLLYQELMQSGASGDWTYLVQQSGMFGFLGLSPDVVLEQRNRFHVYMADNSRISLTGLDERNTTYVARAIAVCLKKRSHALGFPEASL